jgi:hypothetical protein
MKTSPTVRSFHLILTIAIVGCCAVATAVAEELSEPWSTMEKSLRGMQKSVMNVGSVLDHGTEGISTVDDGRNWFDQCCTYNLDKVVTGVDVLRKNLDYLETQYSKKENLDAIIRLNEMRRHLDEIETIFSNMGNSIDVADARRRLNALVHPFNHVRRDMYGLRSCCPVDPPPPSRHGTSERQD